MASGYIFTESSTLVKSQIRASYATYVIDPKTEIRILTLFPPTSSDPDILHGNLSIAKLDDNPSYEALSYVWGEPLFTKRIYLPIGYLAITLNLSTALRTLRYPNRSRRLWANAICINQQGNSKKGHQVDLMSLVYKKTQATLGWLGQATSHSAAAFTMLKEFGNSAWKIGLKSETLFADDLSKVLDESSKARLSKFLMLLIIPAWKQLLSLQWFKRLWITQEAYFHHSYVFVGEKKLSATTPFY